MYIKNEKKLIILFIKTTAAGFEPARENPKRFLIALLNHSDMPSK